MNQQNSQTLLPPLLLPPLLYRVAIPLYSLQHYRLWARSVLGSTPTHRKLLPLPMPLYFAGYCHQIVGKVSSWIDPDSPEPELAQRSAAALQQELSWAAFLGLQAVLLPTPQQQHKGAFNFAQVVNQVGVVELQGECCSALVISVVAVRSTGRERAEEG